MVVCTRWSKKKKKKSQVTSVTVLLPFEHGSNIFFPVRLSSKDMLSNRGQDEARCLALGRGSIKAARLAECPQAPCVPLWLSDPAKERGPSKGIWVHIQALLVFS